MADKTREFSEFVAEEYEKAGRLTKKAKRKDAIKVTYHDSCHLKRVLDIHEQPRKLIDASEGYELVEMKDADKCCGMSGSFGVLHSNLSTQMLNAKMKNIKDTDADVIACACSGCMVQLQGGVDKQAPGMTMKHVADILAEELERKKAD